MSAHCVAEAKSTELPTGALIPQPHGGALRNGGPSSGGSGPPSSALREHLRGSFASRVRVLETIADGEVIQRARLPLAMVLPHVECPNCGKIGVSAREPKTALLVQIEAQVSASPADRIRALDVLAKYGVGQVKAITDEDVRDRLTRQIRNISEDLPRLIRAMGEGATATVGKVALPLQTPEDVAEALLKMVAQHWR